MRVSAVIYTHQGKSHLKIALRLRETFLDKLSRPVLIFLLLLFYSKGKKTDKTPLHIKLRTFNGQIKSLQ